MYNIGYTFLKNFYYKNLHVINTDTYEITNSDLKEFKNKFYKIYSNVHNDFIDKYIEIYENYFDIDFIEKLQNNIQEYRTGFKKKEDEAKEKLKEIIKQEAEKKANQNEKDDDKREQIIIDAKNIEFEMDTAKQEYEIANAAVDKLRRTIYEIEGKSDIVNAENMMGDVKDDDEIITSQPIAQSIAQPIAQPITQLIAQPITQPIAQPIAQPITQPIAQPIAQPIEQPIASRTIIPGDVATVASALPRESTSSSETGEITRASYLELLTHKSFITREAQDNIPDRIWINIIKNEGWQEQQHHTGELKYNYKFDWGDIIKEWKNKKITGKEKEENKFWEDAAKENSIRYGDTLYPVKPLAELQELIMIGRIPSRWTIGIKGLKNLEKIRIEGDLLRQLWEYHRIFLAAAAKSYFKKEYNQNFEDYKKQDNIYKKIKTEFTTEDNYRNSILNNNNNSRYPLYHLQNNVDSSNPRKTTRTRFYLIKEQMDFYKKYIDIYNEYSATDEFRVIENKTLFLLSEPIDNDIEEFKRVDRFLAVSYEITLTDIYFGYTESDYHRNIIIMPENDKIIYLKYKNFFDKHYKHLKEGENLIFVGKKYDMMTKKELSTYLENIKIPNFEHKIVNYNL